MDNTNITFILIVCVAVFIPFVPWSYSRELDTCNQFSCRSWFCAELNRVYPEQGYDSFWNCNVMSYSLYEKATFSIITKYIELCHKYQYTGKECVDTIKSFSKLGYTFNSLKEICDTPGFESLCFKGKLDSINHEDMEPLLRVKNLNPSSCLNQNPPISSLNPDLRRLVNFSGWVKRMAKTKAPYDNYCDCQQVIKLANFFNKICPPPSENYHKSNDHNTDYHNTDDHDTENYSSENPDVSSEPTAKELRDEALQVFMLEVCLRSRKSNQFKSYKLDEIAKSVKVQTECQYDKIMFAIEKSLKKSSVNRSSKRAPRLR